MNIDATHCTVDSRHFEPFSKMSSLEVYAERLVTFNKKTVGRDKIYRFIQYAARFVIVSMNNAEGLTERRKETLRKLQKLESSLSFGRKSCSACVWLTLQ